MATKEVKYALIVQDVLIKSQKEPGSDTDAEDTKPQATPKCLSQLTCYSTTRVRLGAEISIGPISVGL